MQEIMPIPDLQFQDDLEVAGKLTPKMVLFIGEICGGAGICDAAERAGYARSAGYRLMKVPAVLETVTRRRAAQLRKLEVSEQRVVEELAKLAFFDPRDFFNSDGSLKNIQDLDDIAGAALAGLDIVEMYEGRGENRERVGEIKKLRFASKQGALELLGRYLKMWTDRIEVSGPEALADRLRKARLNSGKVIEADGNEQQATGS